jgi:hypothetical protein
MKQGERKRLYRSCRHLIAIILLAGGAAVRAQNTDPLFGGPKGELFPKEMAERSELSPHVPSIYKLSAQGDTIVTPGKRDFLEPNVPNPFGSGSTTTRIAYSISEESHVILKVYDFFYEEVATLVDSVESAGYHFVQFDPQGRIASGMYFYELRTERTRDIKRMLYIR